MRSVRYALVLERAVLRLRGEATRGFLQGLITNDVSRVGGDTALYAMLLTPQGRYAHEFFLYQDPDDPGGLVMETEAARLDALARRLMLYRLRAKVAIEPHPSAVAVAWGEEAAAAFGLAATAGAARRIGGVTIAADPRAAALGVRLVGETAAIEALADEAGIDAGPVEDYHAWRIGLCVPDATQDLVPERSLPLEVGLDRLNGVDFAKGCYVGQELTARTKYRGLLKKRLLAVGIEGAAPDPGTPVMQGGRQAGEVRGSAKGKALAVLRLEALDREGPLTAGDAVLTRADAADA